MITEFPKVWGPTRPALAAAWVLVAIGVVSAVASVVAGFLQALQGDVEALVIGLALAALFGSMFGVSGWRFGLWPRITADDEGVKVRNPGQETFLRWTDIVDASAGYSGITLHDDDPPRSYRVAHGNASVSPPSRPPPA